MCVKYILTEANADRGLTFDNSPDYIATACIIQRHWLMAEAAREDSGTPAAPTDEKQVYQQGIHDGLQMAANYVQAHDNLGDIAAKEILDLERHIPAAFAELARDSGTAGTPPTPLAHHLSHGYEFSTQEDSVKAMDMGARIAAGVRREDAKIVRSRKGKYTLEQTATYLESLITKRGASVESGATADARPPMPKNFTWSDVCSRHGDYHDDCGNCRAGHWVNDELHELSQWLYENDPKLWRKWANRETKPGEPGHESRTFLEKVFPGLRRASVPQQEPWK